MSKAYVELVAQAEQAVSEVKDPELRRVAFEKVLDDLLAGSGGRTQSHSGASAAARGASATEPNAPQSKTRQTKRPRAPKAGGKRGGPQKYIEDMTADSFFAKQKTIAEVKAELENRGHHIPLTSLSGPLQKLCQKKTLRRQKVEANGNKKTFVYSNW